MEISPIGYEALAQRESPDAVIVVTGAGRVLHWNLGAQLIFGYSSDEAIGCNIAGLLGGRLTFRSEYGKGSVFTLQLAED